MIGAVKFTSDDFIDYTRYDICPLPKLAGSDEMHGWCMPSKVTVSSELGRTLASRMPRWL